MCGIVGFIGHENCSSFLLDGLKKLEYRGYDSAGIAIHTGETIAISKAVGKLEQLETKIKNQPINGLMGIGHTRWATHGIPSEVNAHPHFYRDEIAVVHNGIIENYKDLRWSLEQLGYRFQTQTDSEVLPYLIHSEMKHEGGLLDAVRKALNLTRGSFAVAIITKGDPNKIIVASRGMSMVIGKTQEFVSIGSDVMALGFREGEVYYLNYGEIAEVSLEQSGEERGDIHISLKTILKGEEVKLVFERCNIALELDNSSKGMFEHYMIKEISEQSRVVKDSLLNNFDFKLNQCTFSNDLKDLCLADIKRIIFVACGSSYHAALYGKYFIESLAIGIYVFVELASEFIYREQHLTKDEDLIVIVSQSGETADCIHAIQMIKELDDVPPFILGITNVKNSSVARLSDGVLYTYAGPEIGVASTKCFMGQLTLMVLFGAYFSQRRTLSFTRKIKIILDELNLLPNKMNHILSHLGYYQGFGEELSKYKNILFLGRKWNYPIALEGALKLKEVTYIHAEGYATGEMKHGPLALVEEDYPVIVIAPNDSVLSKNLSNIEEIKARKGKVFTLTNIMVKIGSSSERILIPETIEELTPFLTIVPLQLVAYYAGIVKGTDVDKPRNIAKTVTVE